MVRFAGSDIPNLSKIVEETCDSISIYGNYDDDCECDMMEDDSVED